MKANKYILSLLLACGMATSCDSLLDIDPPTDSMTDKQIFSSEETITIAANGFYTSNFLNNSVFYFWTEQLLGLVSDEFNYKSSSYGEYEQNNYSPMSGWMSNSWILPYRTIYQCNDFIINVEGTNLMDAKKRDGFLGEARFFRAYSYFLLVNSFGDVPLVLSNVVEETSKQGRTPKAEVYNQIIEDLKFGEKGLIGSPNRITKITTDACKALLSRAYLYTEQWEKAKNKASELIPAAHGGTGANFTLEDVDHVFKSSSSESILHANMEGYLGPGTYVGYNPVAVRFLDTRYMLSRELVADLQSDPKDKRNSWIKQHDGTDKDPRYYPYKYKNRTSPKSVADYEFLVLLRLTEQYLIRAEANAHLGNLDAAIADINIIRDRAGLEPFESTGNVNDVLMEIETQRRKEFFVECGHRWFDLNRTGRADAVYKATSYKKFWESYKSVLPIPDSEIGRNPHLEQNPGY